MTDDKKFPYTTVPNNLRKLLQKIPTLGAPPKATQKWLASIGFAGGNNQTILPVLRHIGVISKTGEPTEYWTALRSSDAAKFAEAVRAGYGELFTTYTDAHKQDTDTLKTFFRTHTGLGEKAQSFSVRTFKVLVEFGDFDKSGGTKAKVDDGAKRCEAKPDVADGSTQRRGEDRDGASDQQSNVQPFALTVNLQIELPPSANGEVYDRLFAAMGKHLKGLITPPR